MSDHSSTTQVPRISLIPAEMYHALIVAHAEIARLRLTDEERGAIERSANESLLFGYMEDHRTLQQLLERTK